MDRFNAAVDCLIYLEADLATVRAWKKESSQRDADREGMPWDEATAMKAWDTWIEPFVEKYELPLIAQADIVVSKSSTHRIRKCAKGKEERLRQYFTNMCGPGEECASLGAVQGTLRPGNPAFWWSLIPTLNILSGQARSPRWVGPAQCNGSRMRWQARGG